MADPTSIPTIVHRATRYVPVWILAPSFFGYSLSLLLAGILVVQVYIYHLTFPADSWVTKTTVYLVLTLELVQIALQMHDNYQTSVQHWGDPTLLEIDGSNWFAIPIITAIIASIVQSSFAWRIRVLSKSLVWPTVVWAMATIQLGAGLAYGIAFSPLFTYPNFYMTRPAELLWGTSSALNNVLIAILLTFYLTKRKSAFAGTNTILTRIVGLIVGSGIFIAVWAVVIFFLYILAPGFIEMPVNVISKCYSISLMVMLGQRINLRDPSQITLDTYRGSEAARENRTSHAASLPSYVAGEAPDGWESVYGIGKQR